MQKEMTARYAGRCEAGAECEFGGQVAVGDRIWWRKEGRKTVVVHVGACTDVAEGNEFGRREAQQERAAFERELAQQPFRLGLDREMTREMEQGAALADHVRQTRQMFGEEAAAAEELAWELKLGDW